MALGTYEIEIQERKGDAAGGSVVKSSCSISHHTIRAHPTVGGTDAGKGRYTGALRYAWCSRRCSKGDLTAAQKVLGSGPT
jgi:hypothetical protein